MVTVADIARILKLNQQTVRNWIDTGALPALRMGRRVRVRWGDLEAIMKPAGPAVPGGTSSAPSVDAQGCWMGEYLPEASL